MSALDFYNISVEMIQRCYELSDENSYYDKAYNFLCDIQESEKEMKDLSLKQRNWLFELSIDLKEKW